MISSGHTRIDGILYLLVGGPMALMWGLHQLQNKRLLQNTPCSKIRSAAMGVVELAGISLPNKPLVAPLSQRPVCWWKCRVEELRSNGKSSYWALLKEIACNELFYLDDTTGKVLVNPFGAELHICETSSDLNSGTRTVLAPVLAGWGLDDHSWFGLNRRTRVIEQSIPESSPIFLRGELVTVSRDPDDRRARFNARLREIKADRAKMAQANANGDGTVDLEEWDAFVAKQQEEFTKEELIHSAQQPDANRIMIKAPVTGPFIIATGQQEDLLKGMAWLAPLGIFGGVMLCAVGSWLALLVDWNPLVILGTMGIGFTLSYFGKTFGIFGLKGERL